MSRIDVYNEITHDVHDVMHCLEFCFENEALSMVEQQLTSSQLHHDPRAGQVKSR